MQVIVYVNVFAVIVALADCIRSTLPSSTLQNPLHLRLPHDPVSPNTKPSER